MQTTNYISPKLKRQFESILRKFPKLYINYSVIAINDWFGITYPSIWKMDKTRKEYGRLYCQYLWRQIADHEDIDYKEAIKKLVNLVEHEIDHAKTIEKLKREITNQ